MLGRRGGLDRVDADGVAVGQADAAPDDCRIIAAQRVPLHEAAAAFRVANADAQLVDGLDLDHRAVVADVAGPPIAKAGAGPCENSRTRSPTASGRVILRRRSGRPRRLVATSGPSVAGMRASCLPDRRTDLAGVLVRRCADRQRVAARGQRSPAARSCQRSAAASTACFLPPWMSFAWPSSRSRLIPDFAFPSRNMRDVARSRSRC